MKFPFFKRKKSVGKDQLMLGVVGTVIDSAGRIEDFELSKELQGRAKYTTYGNILANTSIVATGVRFFLHLAAKARWTFQPTEADPTGKYAELAEEILIKDCLTPWHRIVRRAVMYRFYGFSVQEWTVRKREDGVITFKDISPRAQQTIIRWELDKEGIVTGIIQESPTTYKEIYLPRYKCLYVTDGALEAGPEGLGIFRHLVLPCRQLKAYEKLETVGFEGDLRGIPIGRGPFTQLQKMENTGGITKSQRTQIEFPMRDFIKNHIRNVNTGLLIDSQTYIGEDELSRISTVPQWSVDLLKSGPTGLSQIANAISRVNRDIARVLGVEQLLLGDGTTGSYALSADKTHTFFLTVDGALRELAETIEADLLDMIWQLNNWPLDTKPTIKIEAVRFQDIIQITTALKDMAAAGAILSPEDPVINEVRGLLGLISKVPDNIVELLNSSDPDSNSFNTKAKSPKTVEDS